MDIFTSGKVLHVCTGSMGSVVKGRETEEDNSRGKRGEERERED